MSTSARTRACSQAGATSPYTWPSCSAIESPALASDLGIRVIYQEAPLIDALSVLESVAVFRGYGAASFGRVSWRRLRRETAELLERVNVHVKLNELCVSLTGADRAAVSLAVALGGRHGAGPLERPSMLIVDEATAAIPDKETDRFLRLIRSIADEGAAVLIITHRLAELRIADDVTVLRAGQVIYRQGSGERLATTELVDMLVGKSVTSSTGASAPPRRRPVSLLWEKTVPAKSVSPLVKSAPAIEITGLTGGALRGFDLTARAGEVVGFMGSSSEGLQDLPAILSGRARRAGGTIAVRGRPVPPRISPRETIRAGIAGLPSDRLRDGGVGREHDVLGTLRRQPAEGPPREVAESATAGVGPR